MNDEIAAEIRGLKYYNNTEVNLAKVIGEKIKYFDEKAESLFIRGAKCGKGNLIIKAIVFQNIAEVLYAFINCFDSKNNDGDAYYGDTDSVEELENINLDDSIKVLLAAACYQVEN